MSTVYYAETLITAEAEDPIEDAAILVEEGLIKEVGKVEEVNVPRDAKPIDLYDGVLMPGMIDCHIHCLMDASPDPMNALSKADEPTIVLRGANHLKSTLKAGVTYVRDLGGLDYIEMSLREAIDNGLILGPNMQVAGRVITMTGGHGHAIGREADGKEETKKAAREQLKAGAEVIKVMATGGVLTEGVQPGASQLDEDELKAAICEAKKVGKKTATHAQGTEGIKNAVRAGIDSVEHGLFLDQETINLMKEQDVWLVPTLTATHKIIEAGVEKGIPEYAVKKTERARESHLASFEMAMDAGIKIATGTDAGTPFNEHGDNPQEIELMVRYGMDELEAIRAATIKAAQLLGVDEEAGSIEPGKRADFVCLDGNPLQDVENVRRVRAVFKGGVQVV